MRILALLIVSPLFLAVSQQRVAARPGAVSANAVMLLPHLSINGGVGATMTTCSTDLFVSAVGDITYEGTWLYSWTLYRNGSSIASGSQTIDCPPGGPCQPPSFSKSIPAVSGIYKVKLVVATSQEWSNQIDVTASSGSPTAIPKINGDASIDHVEVCPGGPITLDASGSTCATSYFASIEISDASWNRKGYELAQWLGESERLKYGPISAFNVKKWAEDKWFTFVGGQYYRVKLAVGPGWNDRTQLIHIKTPVPVLKLNGQSAQSIDIPGPSYKISLNGASSICPTRYFASIQRSDANWNRYGPEAMKWLDPPDMNAYGPISQFNIKKFAEDRGFSFAPGQYYRVKLAIAPDWTETTTLIYLKP